MSLVAREFGEVVEQVVAAEGRAEDLLVVLVKMAVAAGQPPGDLPLLTVLEAGRKRLAAGEYAWSEERWQASGDVRLVTIEELVAGLTRPTRIAGELNTQAHTRLSESAFARIGRPADNLRRPAILAELAWARFQAGEADDPDILAPIYLSTAGIDA